MIDELATAAGISGSYTDYFGNVKHVSTHTKRAILNALGYDISSDRDAGLALKDLAARQSNTVAPVYVVKAGEHVDLPFFHGTLDLGYHELDAGKRSTTIIAVPAHAYVPAALEESGRWGFAVQLYSLRSEHNWGIGDFTDLAEFAGLAASAGADTIALNPLHQLHLPDPARASPYSPNSRLHLNALYVDVDAAASMLGGAPPAPNVEFLRKTDLIDYPGVARVKLGALRSLYDAFQSAGNERKAAFRNFQEDGGVPLQRMAVYEALSMHFNSGWMEWPAAYQDPDSHAVATYAREHRHEVQFYAFLQWLADMQLAAAARAASNMAVGLYRDLAIGVDSQSVDVWGDRDAFCLGLSAGAPPDALNATGQNWGLPPLNPIVLRERAYAPLRTVLRANMRHAGALRIDHVMGLMRLFVIPSGAPPGEGAYLSYTFDDLAGVLALESVSNRCMVVGEDLGTLPHGFRERIAESRFFSCRLLYFERDEDGAFRDPSEYPRDAVASTGTHDLPPLAGFWRDLPPRDRKQLLDLVGESPEATELDVVASAYRALARTRARLMLVQMEDALLQAQAVNVPGTTTEAPNWRRKLPVPIEMLQDDARFATIVTTVREARSRAKTE